MNNMRINRIAAPWPETPTVVSILSGKGGVGKSIISFNLAAMMAGDGQRALLIDNDRHFGNQHILCNVSAKYSLADLAAGTAQAGQIIIPVSNNLDLIASPAAVGTGNQVENQAYDKMFQNMRMTFAPYDFIFLDTSSGDVDLILSAAKVSDLSLLIMNPELTSISDTYGLFKYLLKSKCGATAQLLINRVQNAGESEFIYEKFSTVTERFLRQPILLAGHLLEDKRLIESVARQKSVFEIDQNCPSMEGFLQLRGLLTKIKSNGLMVDEFTNPEIINQSRTSADKKE